MFAVFIIKRKSEDDNRFASYLKMTIWKSSEKDESKRIKLHQINEIAKVLQGF